MISWANPLLSQIKRVLRIGRSKRQAISLFMYVKFSFFPFSILAFGFWHLAFVDFCISILHYSFGLQQIIVNIWFQAQASICVSRAMKWWEKTLHPNMVEIHSAQELVDSLKNAGDRLVVVDFYSPGCGGCRALHPKVYSIFSLCSRDQITNSYISV